MKQNDTANWRTQRDGKTAFEKEEYRQFINSTPAPTPTVKEDKSPIDTDSSSVEEKESKKPRVTKKSLRFKILDALANNWVITIAGGVIATITATVFLGYFTLWSDSKAIKTDINNDKERLTKLETNYSQQNNTINNLDKQLNIWKTEISKDIDYIKQLLPNSSKR